MAVIDNMVAYWAFDEGSGNATDSHGSNTLTQNGTIGSTTGKVGNCRETQSATTEYFSRADNTDLSTGDIDFSFQIWVNLTVASGVLIGKDVDTPGSSRDYTLDLSAAVPRFYINGGGGGLMATWGASLSTATWYHICCGHSASLDELWITVNAGTPVTAGTSGAVPQDSGAEFRIGARAYASFEGYTDAFFDETAMWKRDIRSDVSWLYNSGNGRDYAAIVAAGGRTTKNTRAFPLGIELGMNRGVPL